MKRSVFVTGGGGFIGRALAREFSESNDVHVLVRDQHKAAEVSAAVPAVSVHAADLTDLGALRATMRDIAPDVVIHAAAMKSVGEAEQFPLTCADVNVTGSQSVARVALELGCHAVIGLSSNRAAPPTGDTYGLSKAIMERVFCSLNEKSDTRFTSLRLGNIAWSDGSVLPAWQAMLEAGSPIQSRGRQMHRFLTTLDETVDLIVGAVDEVDTIAGKVVAPQMKQFQVKNLLDAFISVNGGTWTETDESPVDRIHETLIGDLETPYCRREEIDGVARFVLAFNDKSDQPLDAAVTTHNAEAFTVDELVEIVSNRPDERSDQ